MSAMVIAVRRALTYRFKLRHSCAFHRLTERPFHMNFASDNTAPVAPAILDAIVEASRGYARGYGNDDWTQAVERRLSEVFEREVAVFLVPTGTAANALSLAQVTPPWGIVLCLAESHIVTDECGAPEFFGGGFKLVGLPGDGGKITPATLRSALAGYGGHSPHQMIPSALSITQASEAGTIYRPGEIAVLCDIAHERGLAVHMDGARFANALVRLNATPAQLTWRAGIDVLSFGATKGGALAAEAVVIFDPARAAFMGERRKRAGHLLSKHRFIAAQFAAYLANDCWLTLARHANAMADRLAEQLAAAGLTPVWAVEANLIFLVLPRALDAKLRAAGANYYVRTSESLNVGADDVLVRLVTSFATEDDDIERFVDLCKNC
jgi:threonine aldolase